jgi:hypothetical protein
MTLWWRMTVPGSTARGFREALLIIMAIEVDMLSEEQWAYNRYIGTMDNFSWNLSWSYLLGVDVYVRCGSA